MFLRHAACSLAACLAIPLTSAAALADPTADPTEELLDALHVDEIVEIMRDEGRDYTATIAQDMLPSGETPAWEEAVAQLYDPESMQAVVRAGFADSFADTDATPLLEYFTSEEGQRVVTREIEARREMIDPAVEGAAREAWREQEGAGDPRLELLDRFVAANDLVEVNVVGALNANFQFYLGLVDGGGLELTESEIVDDVWMQEEATRADTREWLYAYLLTAYGPLPDAEVEAYAEISASPEGVALNRALFAGFNLMYSEISYGLGLAAAREMMAQDL